ncbi:hypothetical protein LCGC14_2486550, partial [marine sediment metagenome]
MLTVKNLIKHFDISGGLLDQLKVEKGRIVRRRTTVKALNGVSLTILPRETLGVVGESGCGKSTLARVLVRLHDPTAGRVLFEGRDISSLEGDPLKQLRSQMQFIFQDPYSSLDPRAPVGNSIAEGLVVHGVTDADERHERVSEML